MKNVFLVNFIAFTKPKIERKSPLHLSPLDMFWPERNTITYLLFKQLASTILLKLAETLIVVIYFKFCASKLRKYAVRLQ